MVKSKKTLSVLCIVTIAALAINLWPEKHGFDRYFKDQHFHYETLRVMAHAPYGGADIGEVLSIVRNIREKNTEDWYREWFKMAEFVENKASSYNDSLGKGMALMRAQNYYRNSEFYLSATDPRRKNTFSKSSGTFRQALGALEIDYDEISIPYEGKSLKAMFFPSQETESDTKALLIAHGGYDSTLEELYFWFVLPALQRGYSILVFSGPGQGSAIRNEQLTFTHEWERPTSAVIDQYTKLYGAPDRTVLLGLSLGGLLAPRAAAFDKRIDGVVAFDAMYDFKETVFTGMPTLIRPLIRWLNKNDHTSVLEALIGLRMRLDVGSNWGVTNGQWVMGFDRPGEIFEAFEPYTLENVANKITSDVLLLWGEEDHFVGEDQLTNMQNNLTAARSVTTKSYSKYEGGMEHAQTGILTSVHADIFDWIGNRFPDSSK